MNGQMQIAVACVLLTGVNLPGPERLVAQSAPRRQVVQAGLATLHVTIKGSGEPIVFIPSRGRGVEDFDDLSERLVRAGYQAILPEPRGIGGSTGPLDGITYHELASDVAAVIQSVARGPATVIAHAFGTRVARTLASDHPRSIKRLILLAPAGAVPRSAATEATTRRFWETPLSQTDRLAVLRQVFFAPGNDPHVWAKGWHFEVARAQRAADSRTPLKDWWGGGSAPMLVLQGTDDVVVLPENAKRLAAEFPERVMLIEIAHAGHAMLPEQPDAIAKAVLANLRRAAPPSEAVSHSGTLPAPDTVVVPSGRLRLTGLLWRPEGSGPFPAILFSHGSGLRVDAAVARDRAHAIGPVFAKHGYVFLYLFRRGYGLSEGQGESLRDTLDRESKARGEEARRHLQVTLLTTDHLDDVIAGLSFLRRLAGVDAARVALAGHSFGGQLTLLAAERDKTVRAAITFGAAADSWGRSSELRVRLLAAVRNISAPTLLTHAANDYSIAPGQLMAAELARLGRTHQLKIYPPAGDTPEAGHYAVYTAIDTWEDDVFRFVDEHLRRR